LSSENKKTKVKEEVNKQPLIGHFNS